MAEAYDWPGGQEQILRFGPHHGPQIVFVPPLFEEANRTRHLIVSVMRQLAAQGFGTALPDLPAMGDSLRTITETSFADWETALAHACNVIWHDRPPLLLASFRGGCLIDVAAGAEHVWRMSPEPGARIVRDLQRTRAAKSLTDAPSDFVELAGHRFTQNFLDDLAQRELAPLNICRTVRLKTEAAEADIKIEGGPLWRRSEPGDDTTLEAAILADLSEWAHECVR